MSVAFHIAVHLVTLGHKDLDVAHPHHLPILPHAHLRVLRIIELYIRNARAPASSSYQMNPINRDLLRQANVREPVNNLLRSARER